jgi:2-polyprenyl-6-methoxyphenol hydroxylase-like FAD-dependent oxidoreductase
MPYEIDRPILIIGAGPTGLTLAIELARRGIPLRIVDAAVGPFVGSRGKGIQPRTLEVFDHLGIAAEVIAEGGAYPRMRFHVGRLSFRGGSLGTRHAPRPGLPYPNLWQVPQFKTEAVLRRKLESCSTQVEWGVGFEGLEQHASHVVVTLHTGERVEASYVVGCDGGRSAVRKAIGLTLRGEGLDPRPALVADVVMPGLSRDDWHVYPLARGGMITLCPLPGTDFFQVTAPGGLAPEQLATTLERVTKQVVDEVRWRSQYVPQARMVERYRVGRVFLAGDAAHVHPPAGGQGLNTGVQDAWNLGWKLAWATRGGPDDVLDTYEEERLPVAAAVLGLSKELHVHRSMKRGARTSQLGIGYRASSLSSGEALGALQPGDRVEDALLRNGARRYDFLRGVAATRFRAGDGVHILVRPDGYIARISQDVVDTYAGAPVQHVDGWEAAP